MPGEEQNMLLLFGTTDFPVGSRASSLPGRFRVQFLLARPGRLKFSEKEPSFLTNLVGDSHLGVGKPSKAKAADDIVAVSLQTSSGNQRFNFDCIINEHGYIGKIVVEGLLAQDYADAESIAYKALAPFLSMWSLTLDIPILVETVQVTDLTTHTEMLRIVAPYVEMKPGAGPSAPLSESFCHYASFYREGMNSHSPFYRFLCFYKIVESLNLRRGQNAKEARLHGEEPKKYQEDVPLSREAIRGILGLLYPSRSDWDDDLTMNQILPNEAHGKRFKFVRAQYLEPIRDRIAHALRRSGMIEHVADRLEDVNTVTKWLPLLRLWVRVMLKSEFPTEFGWPAK
jgi:hypothetical protein